MLTVGSLFAGIGGFDLGLERAGMRTVWFCEQDPFCRRVLARHWPGVPCHPDVRGLFGTGRALDEPAGTLGALPVPVPYVDVLCGGFPCQDISLAGRGAGLAGERSGLWREFARIIGELRPRYVLVENVPALTSRGLDVVLGDLAACGFDAEWDHLPASAFGAPHRRDRIWLVAYPGGGELREQPGRSGGQGGSSAALAGVDGEARPLADSARDGAEEQAPAGTVGERARPSGERAGALGDPDSMARAPGGTRQRRPCAVAQPRAVERAVGSDGGDWNPWLTEPDVGRVAHGIPARVDRLRALGNSLVPQIAEWIGRQIVEWERVSA